MMFEVSRMKKEPDAPEPLGVHERKNGNDFGGGTEFVFLKLMIFSFSMLETSIFIG